MTPKQTEMIGRVARLLRDSYFFSGGLSREEAAAKTLEAFTNYLAGTRGKGMRKKLRGERKKVTLIDAVGAVEMALGAVGLATPDAWAQETIIETARRALSEGGAIS